MRAPILLTAVVAALLVLPSASSWAARPARRRPPAPKVEERAVVPEKASSGAPAGAPTGDVAVGPRGPTRIDFDDRLIQGQTNKSGAVYLFDRKELAVRSMVRQRTSFRDQIVKDILTE